MFLALPPLRHRRDLLFALTLTLTLCCGAADAAGVGEPMSSPEASGTIAALVPDVAEPYREIFAKMVDGMESATHTHVKVFLVGANVDPADLNARIRSSGARLVVALGRQGVRATVGLDSRLPVLVGGVMMLSEADHDTLTGISLSPDPALLFARLKALQPSVRRVLVVYDPQYNEWLIKLAREAARTEGLELAAYETHDLAAAAKVYEKIFASANGQRDALWLPQDPTTVEESTLLPLVLRESWNRSVAVFSSSYPHVKKGALFALYPNNAELGRDLGLAALRLLAGETRHGMLPLREVYTGVNLRSASHLGINIDHEQQRTLDAVFPEQ